MSKLSKQRINLFDSSISELTNSYNSLRSFIALSLFNSSFNICIIFFSKIVNFSTNFSSFTGFPGFIVSLGIFEINAFK